MDLHNSDDFTMKYSRLYEGLDEPFRIATSSTTWSKVRGRAARKKAFSFANAYSIGLKSGLYGGRKRSLAPTRSIAA